MKLSKATKWGASAIRLTAAKVRLGRRLRLLRGGKPIYLGNGAVLKADEESTIVLGAGCYLDDRTRVEALKGGSVEIGENVFMNTNCRVVSIDSIRIEEKSMFGPNVCIYDHDHLFDDDGVHGELLPSCVHIGKKSWIAANSVITKGVRIGDKVLVGAGSVVTSSLLRSGVYAGTPACAIRYFDDRAGIE